MLSMRDKQQMHWSFSNAPQWIVCGWWSCGKMACWMGKLGRRTFARRGSSSWGLHFRRMRGVVAI